MEGIDALILEQFNQVMVISLKKLSLLLRGFACPSDTNPRLDGRNLSHLEKNDQKKRDYNLSPFLCVF